MQHKYRQQKNHAEVVKINTRELGSDTN